MDIKNAPNHSRKNPPFLYYTMMISRPKLKNASKMKKNLLQAKCLTLPCEQFLYDTTIFYHWNIVWKSTSLESHGFRIKKEKLFRLSWKFIWRISSIRHKLHLDCKIFDVRCAFWSYAPFNPNGPFTPNLDPLFCKVCIFELSVSKAHLQNRWPPKITFLVD